MCKPDCNYVIEKRKMKKGSSKMQISFKFAQRNGLKIPICEFILLNKQYVQYHSKVSYHLSSCFSRDENLMLRDKSLVS